MLGMSVYSSKKEGEKEYKKKARCRPHILFWNILIKDNIYNIHYQESSVICLRKSPLFMFALEC